ncbi:hypothetical protein ES703_63020 [subsurface metagenome]
MDEKEKHSYWNELKESKTKISLGTNTDLFYTGYILDYSDTGIILEDRNGEKIFLNFTNIKFCGPYTEKGKK